MEPLVRWRAFLEASRGVVLLVDGIDAPLRKAPEEGRAEVGRFLEGFLTMVKNLGSGLRFCLITGEAMGLDLAAAVNNFSDVSGDLPFGDLLGFTTADLRTGLRPLVERKAEALGTTPEAVVEQIERTWGGRTFDELRRTRVAQPAAVLAFLTGGEGFPGG